MSPRPRTVTDGQILEATGRIIGRLGPARFTLADVAAEIGLAPATLVQRFGSKRGLMLALAGSSVEFVDACFARIRDANPAPLAALRVAATHMASMVESPESLANHLAFLQIDLSDPDFHALALDNHLRIEAGYRALLDDAVAAGELAPCDTARLARAVGAVAGGSLIGWAITRGGDVVTHVREDVDTLLAPYAAAAARTSAAPARRRRARTSS
jgi:AcrR family transcriptional regulator